MRDIGTCSAASSDLGAAKLEICSLKSTNGLLECGASSNLSPSSSSSLEEPPVSSSVALYVLSRSIIPTRSAFTLAAAERYSRWSRSNCNVDT